MNCGGNSRGRGDTLGNVSDEIPALEVVGILTEDLAPPTGESHASQQCLHQSALSRTVRAQEHDELPASQGEVDVAQGLGCSETDRGASDLEDRRTITHSRAQTPIALSSGASHLDNHPAPVASLV